MILVKPPVLCFVCGTDHGKFHEEWHGPYICEQCWEELTMMGQKITAIDVGKTGTPTLAWLGDGTCLTFRSLRKLREAVLHEKSTFSQEVPYRKVMAGS